MSTDKKALNFRRVIFGVGLILLIPLLGRWPWSTGDFVGMGVLLFITGLALEAVTKKMNPQYKIFGAIAVLGIFFLIWAQLSVGLIEKILLFI